MSRGPVTTILQSHPFAAGLWPEYVARLSGMAAEVPALAFDGERLRHPCQEDYAFAFRFIRAILKVVSGRLHAIRTQLVDVYSPLVTVE